MTEAERTELLRENREFMRVLERAKNPHDCCCLGRGYVALGAATAIFLITAIIFAI